MAVDGFSEMPHTLYDVAACQQPRLIRLDVASPREILGGERGKYFCYEE